MQGLREDFGKVNSLRLVTDLPSELSRDVRLLRSSGRSDGREEEEQEEREGEGIRKGEGVKSHETKEME